MGGVSKTVKKVTSNPFRSLADIGTFGTYELARKALPGVANPAENLGRTLTGQRAGGGSSPDVPFYISPEEIDRQRNLVESEGNKQYEQNLDAIAKDDEAQAKYAGEKFKTLLPQLAEDYNGGGLLNSTGYQQEVARQQAQLANDLASESSSKKLAALGQKQGFQTNALERAFSLQDFINQANVAKAIGAQSVPQGPSSKAGGLAGGLGGAGVGANFGPVGAGIGGLAGLLLGSQAYGKKGK